LKDRIEQMQQQAGTWVQQHKNLLSSCTLLDGVKGIGLDNAMIFVSLIGDVTSFASAHQLACAGYYIRSKNSLFSENGCTK
jgi:hypothetical protein